MLEVCFCYLGHHTLRLRDKHLRRCSCAMSIDRLTKKCDLSTAVRPGMPALRRRGAIGATSVSACWLPTLRRFCNMYCPIARAGQASSYLSKNGRDTFA